DGKSFVGRVERGSSGHRPRLEDAVMLKAQIIVETSCCVLLDDEAWILSLADLGLAGRLDGLAEIAHGLIIGQFILSHACYLAVKAPATPCLPNDITRTCVPAPGSLVDVLKAWGCNPTKSHRPALAWAVHLALPSSQVLPPCLLSVPNAAPVMM